MFVSDLSLGKCGHSGMHDIVPAGILVVGPVGVHLSGHPLTYVVDLVHLALD